MANFINIRPRLSITSSRKTEPWSPWVEVGGG